MKFSIALLCIAVLAASVSALTIQEGIERLKGLGYKYMKNDLGNVEMLLEGLDGIQKVFLPNEDPRDSPSQYEALIKRIMSLSHDEVNDALISCSKGDKADFFKFSYAKVGHVGTKGQNQTITLERRPDDCFQRVDVTYTKNSAYEVTLNFQAYNKTGAENCTDVFAVGSTLNLHMVPINHNLTHSFKFSFLTRKQMANIENFGLHIFRMCDKLQNIVPDLLWTLGLFAGGFGLNPNVTFFGSRPLLWQEYLNVNFIKHATGHQWKTRKNTVVDLNETEVQPGDFLSITRFDGLDQIIEWGANSRAGHSAMLLEVDGVLNVVESQDGWYWPKKNIQRNTWAEWKKYAHNAGFNVAVLPLSPESRAKFNKTAAEAWFKSVEGMPYGYHNFLFGWIDTESSNLPPILHADLAAVVFAMLEQLWFIKSIPNPITKLVGESLNKRLNVTNHTIAQIAEIVGARNLTFGQVFAQPEQDGWMYSDGYSYVCSAFVAGVYKAGGLLPANVNAVEFTPFDVYSLNIFDANYTKPAKCEGIDNDLPYCQIMGRWKMELKQYNTITPYEHMCETCPTQPPGFVRPDGC